MTSDWFLYGNDELSNVVSIEPEDGKVVIYREIMGKVKRVEREVKFWVLLAKNYTEGAGRLEGNLHYKYYKTFKAEKDYRAFIGWCQSQGWDYYVSYNLKEMYMQRSGLTYFKTMRPEDVSILSFDIETTGLTHNDDAKVLLISNTLRKSGVTTRKLFSIDEYSSDKEMINAWCKWVCENDPSILVGHNIYNFDIPYLKFRAGSLKLGRDRSDARISSRVSQFRKDGSQSYDYQNVQVYGRELVDTKFLSIKYDIGRNFTSYSLKTIIKEAGLEKEERQHYDAASIARNYTNKVEWAKIKKYAEHDADDALALFDLMIPAFFYYNQSIPKSLQQIINSATGSQVNSFMIRSYLQEKHSIPKASPQTEYEGAISYGNPGTYNHVYKVDVASLYPSLIRQYEICDRSKDPKGYFLKMVEIFTTERLKNKALAKETGERHYKDLEQAQKIMINSAYGFMGAPGLNFNAPKCAAEVTRRGREILTRGVEWAQKANFKIVNVDTDSFSFTQDRPMHQHEFEAFIALLNKQFDELINFEDDGYYDKVIVVKDKNYVLKSGDEVKIKGSALKATMKEPAFKKFIKDIIDLLLDENYEGLRITYNDAVKRISGISIETGIHDHCSKKTVTKAVLNPNRTNEQRIREAIGGRKVEEGDKIRVFFRGEKELALEENFDGVYCSKTLYKKLYMTIKIFEPILDIAVFPNFALKRNQKLLEEMIGEQGRQTSFRIDQERSETTGDDIPRQMA